MRWVALILVLWPMGAEARTPSNCVALAQGAQVVSVRFGAPLAADVVRIRYLQHAMFAIEGGGLLVVTDYTGTVGNPGVVPDVVTMNNAHATH